jgi:hypothetical protein
MSRAHKTARQRVRRIVGIVADLLEALCPVLEPERAVVVGSRPSKTKAGEPAYKHSYHVVFTNIWFAHNYRCMQHFVLGTVIPAIARNNEEDAAAIDKSVYMYSQNRVFRMVGCHKYPLSAGTKIDIIFLRSKNHKFWSSATCESGQFFSNKAHSALSNDTKFGRYR